MKASEQKRLDDFANQGCHVLHVLEEGELPPFPCPVGIFWTSTADTPLRNRACSM